MGRNINRLRWNRSINVFIMNIKIRIQRNLLKFHRKLALIKKRIYM